MCCLEAVGVVKSSILNSALLPIVLLQNHFFHLLQQFLLAENSSSGSTQISLTTPTTSQSHISNACGIPLLPLPFLDSQRTRVTFATAPSPESLNRPLNL